jgi:hypothetical protein
MVLSPFIAYLCLKVGVKKTSVLSTPMFRPCSRPCSWLSSPTYIVKKTARGRLGRSLWPLLVLDLPTTPTMTKVRHSIGWSNHHHGIRKDTICARNIRISYQP